jgi:hypothetical protein
MPFRIAAACVMYLESVAPSDCTIHSPASGLTKNLLASHLFSPVFRARSSAEISVLGVVDEEISAGQESLGSLTIVGPFSAETEPASAAHESGPKPAENLIFCAFRFSPKLISAFGELNSHAQRERKHRRGRHSSGRHSSQRP